MSWPVLISGGAVVTAVVLDALWTTVSAQGGGPISRRFSTGLWRVLVWRAGPTSTRRQTAGAIVLLTTVTLWIVALWAGWTLVFSAASSAVVSSAHSVPADVWERVYYVGFTVFTLGTGDFVPSGDLWRVLTAVSAGSGLFLVTLAITYLLPVLQAVVAKRQLAASISGLGTTGADIVTLTAQTPEGASRVLVQIASDLAVHTERHLVYPVLHFFQSGSRATAVAPALASLSDALLLLECLPGDRRPDPIALAEVRSALGGYLDTVHGTFVATAKDAPPVPAVPTDLGGAPSGVERAAHEHAQSRRRLLALVHSSGWDWPVSSGG